MKRTIQTALLVALAGCATAGGTSDSDPFTEGRADTVRLLVRNLNFADARLYTLRRGTTRRLLGTLTGKQEAEYELDWDFSEPLRIEINLLAGPTCTTDELIVDPGDVLELQIEAVFGMSAICR